MSCIDLLDTESLVMKRQTNRGQYDEIDGLPVIPKFTESLFKANVQPVSGFEILQVPEGDRTRQILNIFTEFPLMADDVITRNGIEFEVRSVEDWTSVGPELAHHKARIVKKDV